MGIFDLIVRSLSSPATRRLRAAAIGAELWQDAPRPSADLARRGGASLAVPFSGGPGGPPGRSPGIEWWNDQIPPSPDRYNFHPGYSDHTYQNMTAPQLFDGFDLERIRNANALHRLGWFYESSALMVAILGFAPVMAAAAQAVAPILALPRHVHGGDKGLAKLVRDEIAEALIPSNGLQPSPYFPPGLWGAMALYLRFMGFCVLQHVDGEPDPDTGVRPRYSRIAEPWAIQRWRTPRKAIFMSTEGPVEIKNDGKFTLIEDSNEGHLFDAAILALGEETLAGKLTQEQRLRWQDFFSSPKIVATLPEKVPTQGAAGDAFAAGLEFIYGPDGRGILPFGAKVDAVTYGSGANGAQQFQGTLLDSIVHIFMVLTGSAGTIGNGMNTGAGPGYQPAKNGSWAVLGHLIRRPTVAMVRGINGGHVLPFVDQNYGDARERARKAGAWEDPCITVPLPDPDRDERVGSIAAREEAWGRIAKSRRENGADFSEDQSNKLRRSMDLDPIPLLPQPKNAALIYSWEIEQKVVAVDEARARKGLPALPDGQGSVERLADDRAKGLDKTGQTNVTEAPEATAPAEEDAGPPAQREPPMGEPAAGAPLGAVARRLPGGVGVDATFGMRIGASIHSVKFDTAKAHAVYIRDGYKCQYCGKHDESGQGKGLSIDHIDARARGGAAQNTKGTPATNLVTACGSCNSAKQDRTPRQWNEYQKTSGQAPPPTDWSSLRRQAAKPIDIKAGEKNAAAAKDARDKAKTEKEKGDKSKQGDGGSGGGEKKGDDKGGGGGPEHCPEDGKFGDHGDH